jgi:membrane protein YdbS with pleckstrin-like domain
MYGTAPDVPDALAVRSGFFARRRRVVPAEAIKEVDDTTGVIGLRVSREALKSFL